MANRILSDELQQRWIPKVVPAFEKDVLMHQIRLLIQVRAQTRYVPCIDEFHRVAKRCVFNALMMRQLQPVGERWFFNVRFQSCLTRKSRLAGNGELCVAQLQLGMEDLCVCSAAVTRMKLPDSLGCA